MSIDACAALVEKGDPERFLTAMTAPVELRGRLMVLYAFNLEVARAAWVTKEAMIAEMRLQFWADTLEEIGEGAPARAHEVAGPLSEVLIEGAIPVKPLADLVNARRFDIYPEPHENGPAFDQYVSATSASLMVAAAQALGANGNALPTIAEYGYGAGVAALFRAFLSLKAAGRSPLPSDAPDQISLLANSALKNLRSARASRNQVPKSCTPALLVGWQAEKVLYKAIADPNAVVEGRLEMSEFSKRSRLLFRMITGRW